MQHASSSTAKQATPAGSHAPKPRRRVRGHAHAGEIRVCADAILSKYHDAPVRSFVLTLADRTHASVFRAGRCYALVS